MRTLAVALLALVVVPCATAATFTYSVNTASPVTVATVTLSGDDQTKTFTIQSTVAYTQGQNTAGWNVTAAATTPTAGSNTLPAVQVTGVTSANCTGGGCINPTNSITWPVTLSTTAQRIFNAAAGTGQGTVVLTTTFQLAYPANIFPGTYSSTVTLLGTTGP